MVGLGVAPGFGNCRTGSSHLQGNQGLAYSFVFKSVQVSAFLPELLTWLPGSTW